MQQDGRPESWWWRKVKIIYIVVCVAVYTQEHPTIFGGALVHTVLRRWEWLSTMRNDHSLPYTNYMSALLCIGPSTCCGLWVFHVCAINSVTYTVINTNIYLNYTNTNTSNTVCVIIIFDMWQTWTNNNKQNTQSIKRYTANIIHKSKILTIIPTIRDRCWWWHEALSQPIAMYLVWCYMP